MWIELGRLAVVYVGIGLYAGFFWWAFWAATPRE